MTTKYGIQVDKTNTARLTDQQRTDIVASKAGYYRYYALEWGRVEGTEGTYNWTCSTVGAKNAVDDLNWLVAQKNPEIIPVVIVKGIPTWVSPVTHGCGPLSPGNNNYNWLAFRDMVLAAMTELPDVHYWEI